MPEDDGDLRLRRRGLEVVFNCLMKQTFFLFHLVTSLILLDDLFITRKKSSATELTAIASGQPKWEVAKEPLDFYSNFILVTTTEVPLN